MLLEIIATTALAMNTASADGDYRDRCNKACRRRTHQERVVRPYRSWLRSLAACESGHNPRAYSPAGPYYGLYQFDLSTWQSVGGRGIPSHASRLEQSYRAVLLRKRAGTSPWPVCG